MKNAFFIAAVAILFLASCKAPSYSYVSPTLNNTAYSQAGTGHLGVQFGTIGIGAKGGVAVTDNISLNGFFGGIPEAKNDYTSREGEFSVGFQSKPKNNFVANFYAGTGIGSNEKDKVGLDGDYFRPFIQAQATALDKSIGASGVYLDASFGFRLNYLLYDGVRGGADYDHKVVYTEPYFGFAIGGRNVRFEILQGLAIKSSGTWTKDLRIFPYFGNIGLLVKLRKSNKEVK
jgi:hypothetical protein